MATVLVVGCGAWATTIAQMIARNNHDVLLWCHDAEVALTINQSGENISFLPEIKLEKSIKAIASFDDLPDNVDGIVVGVASPFIQIVEQLKPRYSGQPILILTKGLLPEGPHLFISDYVRSALATENVAVLSGPNLAREIAEGRVSATVIASKQEATFEFFQECCHTSQFRVYTSYDDIGVALGGVLKNVVAIASGILDGLDLGSNAQSALITRGLKEMVELGIQLGAEEKTFYGLSGVGDLITTCTSRKSRNWSVGFAKAQSGNTEEALSKMNAMVAEGVKTAEIVHNLASRHRLELPICEQVYQIFYNDKDIPAAMSELLERKGKMEF